MSAYAGQSVYVSFRYSTDAAIQYEGIYIDDIENITVFGSETLISSAIADTFYTFIDKPEATDLFYKVRAQDADGQWSGYSVLLGTFTSLGYICGDVDGLEGINILDIVFIINYKYKSGPEPDPMVAADVDGIPPVNILDIVYLINYKYKSGPDPACP